MASKQSEPGAEVELQAGAVVVAVAECLARLDFVLCGGKAHNTTTTARHTIRIS